MQGLERFLFRGYVLHRTRGHWGEVALFSMGAALLWWVMRLALGVILAVISVLMLVYLFTH